jgi:hypothetical protein
MDQLVELILLDMHRQAGATMIAWSATFAIVEFPHPEWGIAAIF